MEKVLVISRDCALAHATCAFLSESFSTEACAPGPEAERAVDEGHVDVVVVDVKTPEAEEMRFLRTLKKRRPDLPVVFLSLYASQLSAGGDGHLFHDALFFPKPFDNDAVVAAVMLLGRSRPKATGDEHDERSNSPRQASEI